eukprot:7991559-Ditylum_brightwellii.AAC.1
MGDAPLKATTQSLPQLLKKLYSAKTRQVSIIHIYGVSEFESSKQGGKQGGNHGGGQSSNDKEAMYLAMPTLVLTLKRIMEDGIDLPSVVYSSSAKDVYGDICGGEAGILPGQDS